MPEDAKPTATDPAIAEGTKVDGKDEFLELFNKTTGKEFKSRDEAVKSLDHLNKMVGDNAIASLRTKAEEAENFTKVVNAYSKDHGVPPSEARAALLKQVEEIMEGTQETTQQPAQAKPSESGEGKKALDIATSLLEKYQEKELLEAHPEAKSVINEVKMLAKVNGKDLMKAYEESALKEMAIKAAEIDKKKTEPGTSAAPNARTAPTLEGMADIIKAVKTFGRDSDKEALVKKVLGM